MMALEIRLAGGMVEEKSETERGIKSPSLGNCEEKEEDM